MAAPQEKTVISADGTSIYAIAAGNPTRPALVCVHGFASTSFAFHKQFANPVLLENVSLVAYDGRGNGRSGKPEKAAAYDGRRLAEDFKAVCEAFGVVRPVVLGWSLGGAIMVSITAYLPPAYVRGIVYTGGGVLTRTIHAAYISAWTVGILPAMVGSDAAAAVRANVEFVEGLFARPEEVPYEVKLRWLGEIMLAPPCTRAFIEASSRALDEKPWTEEMRNMRFLVVQGRHDKLVDAEKMEACLKERFGEQMEWVWLEGAGHAPIVEATEEHDAAVMKYMSSLDT